MGGEFAGRVKFTEGQYQAGRVRLVQTEQESNSRSGGKHEKMTRGEYLFCPLGVRVGLGVLYALWTKALLEGVCSFLPSFSLGCSSPWTALLPPPSLIHPALHNLDLSSPTLRNGARALWGLAEV